MVKNFIFLLLSPLASYGKMNLKTIFGIIRITEII